MVFCYGNQNMLSIDSSTRYRSLGQVFSLSALCSYLLSSAGACCCWVAWYLPHWCSVVDTLSFFSSSSGDALGIQDVLYFLCKYSSIFIYLGPSLSFTLCGLSFMLKNSHPLSFQILFFHPCLKEGQLQISCSMSWLQGAVLAPSRSPTQAIALNNR